MERKFVVALSLSIGLHLALAVVLLSGDFSAPLKSTPKATAVEMKPIQAVVVDSSKLQAHINKLKKKEADAKAAENKRIKDLEKRAATAKKKRADEEARLKNLEQQRKKKEKEKKVADAAAKVSRAKAAVAEKIRKQKEAEKKKAEKAAADAKAKRLKEQAAAKKAEDLRKKKAAERRRKEQAARERAEQNRLLEKEMAEEMASRQQARRQQMMSEIGRFTALITQTIQRNLITDRSTMEGKSCKLTISLAPSGFVTNVVTGKGDRIVCNAVKNAIYKVGTLPVPKDPEVFKEFRTLSLLFAPDTF